MDFDSPALKISTVAPGHVYFHGQNPSAHGALVVLAVGDQVKAMSSRVDTPEVFSAHLLISPRALAAQISDLVSSAVISKAEIEQRVQCLVEAIEALSPATIPGGQAHTHETCPRRFQLWIYADSTDPQPVNDPEADAFDNPWVAQQAAILRLEQADGVDGYATIRTNEGAGADVVMAIGFEAGKVTVVQEATGYYAAMIRAGAGEYAIGQLHARFGADDEKAQAAFNRSSGEVVALKWESGIHNPDLSTFVAGHIEIGVVKHEVRVTAAGLCLAPGIQIFG